MMSGASPKRGGRRAIFKELGLLGLIFGFGWGIGLFSQMGLYPASLTPSYQAQTLAGAGAGSDPSRSEGSTMKAVAFVDFSFRYVPGVVRPGGMLGEIRRLAILTEDGKVFLEESFGDQMVRHSLPVPGGGHPARGDSLMYYRNFESPIDLLREVEEGGTHNVALSNAVHLPEAPGEPGLRASSTIFVDLVDLGVMTPGRVNERHRFRAYTQDGTSYEFTISADDFPILSGDGVSLATGN